MKYLQKYMKQKTKNFCFFHLMKYKEDKPFSSSNKDVKYF